MVSTAEDFTMDPVMACTAEDFTIDPVMAFDIVDLYLVKKNTIILGHHARGVFAVACVNAQEIGYQVLDACNCFINVRDMAYSRCLISSCRWKRLSWCSQRFRPTIYGQPLDRRSR
jgi:hypothetical protein